MKKILTISLGLLFAFGLFGCKSKDFNYIEPKTPGEYSYDGKGRLETRITYNSNYGEFGPIARYDGIYDENNNLVFQYWYSYDSESEDRLRFSQAYEIKYKDGKKDTIISYLKNDEKVRRSGKYEYKYDGDKLKTIIDYGSNYNTGSFYKQSTEEYTYDEKGNVKTITHLLVKDENIKGISNYIYEYTYDSNDNVIKTLFKTRARSKDEWMDTECYEYTYDSNGNVLTEIMKSDRTNSSSIPWINEYKKEYTYDSNNNETLVIEYDYNEDWIESSKKESFYDSNNNKIDYKYYKMNNNSWSLYNETTYSYENNKLKVEDHLNEKGVLIYRYEYSYKDYN